jgi:hypothetical protein
MTSGYKKLLVLLYRMRVQKFLTGQLFQGQAKVLDVCTYVGLYFNVDISTCTDSLGNEVIILDADPVSSLA